MVASETRKARAICPALRPQTARSVSATCASLASAGWQQAKTRLSSSSSACRSAPPPSAASPSPGRPPWPAAAGPSGQADGSVTASRASLRSPSWSRRSRSSALRRAVVASQPPGLAGTPSRGQCSIASTNASCTASSASPRSPVRAARAALIRVASCRYARSSDSGAASMAPVFHGACPGPVVVTITGPLRCGCHNHGRWRVGGRRGYQRRGPESMLGDMTEFRLAERMGRLGTESAFEVLARAKALEAAGQRVIHLEIGEPDFPTADHISEAAIEALRGGQTHYVPAPGIPALRESVAAFLERTGRLRTSPDRVVVTPGAKPIMFFTIMALAGPGDEVLYPDPGFPMYESITAFAGATPVPVPLRESNGFRIDVDELARLITPASKLLIINSPHNPCGSALTVDDCAAIASLALRHDLVVLSDEVYWALRYGGQHASVLEVDGMADRTILLHGWAQTYAMTGWRLGFGVFPAALVEPVTRLAINSVSCTSAFSQYGAIAALDGPQDGVAAMVAEFRRRRDVIVAGLNAIDGVSCLEPQGAFYAFPNITGTGLTADELAGRLLREAGVAALAGTAFGGQGEGFLRISYANSVDNIEAALDAIKFLLHF